MAKPRRLKTSDNLDLYYRVWKGDKKKPTLIFLHGIGSNWTEWKHTLEEANKAKYSTIAIDLRGHGFSSAPDEASYYKLEHFAADVRTIVKKEKLNKFVLIGHSLGGSIAIAYMTDYPDAPPQNLVLVAATHRYPYKMHHELNANPLLCIILRNLVNTGVLNNKYFPRPKELDLTVMQNTNFLYKVYDELYFSSIKTIFNALDGAKSYSERKKRAVRKGLQQYEGKTLIVTGDADEIIFPGFSKELHWLIPCSALQVYKNIGHQIPLEDSERISKEIIAFLGK